MNRIWIVFSALLWTVVSAAEPGSLPKPPMFKVNTNPESALDNYPLGVITRQVAFSYHGGPDKKILLANGKQGWVYMLGHTQDWKTYQLPNGDVKTVQETAWERGVRSFTLVFDERVVIDVIYKDDGSGIGVTAMELQHPRPQRAPGREQRDGRSS